VHYQGEASPPPSSRPAGTSGDPSGSGEVEEEVGEGPAHHQGGSLAAALLEARMDFRQPLRQRRGGGGRGAGASGSFSDPSIPVDSITLKLVNVCAQLFFGHCFEHKHWNVRYVDATPPKKEEYMLT